MRGHYNSYKINKREREIEREREREIGYREPSF